MRRPHVEPLESRLVLATASGVENILLPEYIAQLADPNGNQLPASDAWWALRSQRNMAIDEPISKVMNFAAHNAFNSLNEGFAIVPFLAPNQILSLSGQLDVGARLIELDIHDPGEIPFTTRHLVLKHGPGLVSLTRAVPFPFLLDHALAEIQNWLNQPENSNEVIFLDFEDATEQNESSADDPLLPKLQNFLGSLIYTPGERAADGAWPSRAELVSRNKRVIIFSHRNDEFHGRFGLPQEYTDPNGHVWFGSSLAFRANGGEDPVSDRGNFTQTPIDDFDFATAHSENADFFFSVQSDSLRNFTARRYNSDDVANAAALNVDFLKMDFLFGDDEDADLGSNFTNDQFYDIPEDNRIALLEAAVWSWQRGDPAVDRQMFQDLIPGDGTGAAFRNFLAAHIAALGNRLPADTMAQLDAVGAAARANGRDVAIQGGGRFISLAPAISFPLPFAARSLLPDGAGNFEWHLTTGTSANWFDGYQMVQGEFGSGFIFAGPVNGFQNSQLTDLTGGSMAWIHVHDFDHNGNWQVGNRAPKITSVDVQPASSNEGQSVQLTVNFTDDPESHELQIDWGDGSFPTIVQVAAQQAQSVIVLHTYKDDHPQTGTPADNFTIGITLTDADGLSDYATTQVTVNNVAPVIGAFASDTTYANTAAEGEPVNILAGFSDVGILDTHAATVNWGDGSAPEIVTVNQGAGSGTVSGSHVYAAGGIYTITLSLADDDTGVDAATTTAVVTGVGLNNGILFVIGGIEGDHVSINQASSGKLKVSTNLILDSSRYLDLAAVNKIVVYLGDGDDYLTISSQMKIPAVIHGGGGRDHLKAGGGPSALLGDEGDDYLFGQSARNILVGGTGKDVLVAGNGGDVLIGGGTNSDRDDDALIAAAMAWNSPAAYPIRVSAIQCIVFEIDDGNVDVLTGGFAQDLFYNGAGDILKNVKKNELVLV